LGKKSVIWGTLTKKQMEHLQCKACGSFSIVPMDVNPFDEMPDEETDDALDQEGSVYDLLDEILSEKPIESNELTEEESRYFNCHVCGDNWMTIKEVDLSGKCQITFVHQLGMFPLLKRIAEMQTQIILTDNTVQEWVYYLNDEPVAETEWFEKLQKRRKVLKSVCTN
jgi:hypothetical protein